MVIWRAPGPYGASPTQPYKCGQNVKINVKTAERGGVGGGFDVDFKHFDCIYKVG